MEDDLEGEKMKQPELENKTKRKMKTASQLDILEKTYAVETYPSESVRAELSVKLGLSDRQLQMWFCHRRLKDRKTPSAKRLKKDSPPPNAATSVGGNGDELEVRNVENDHGSGSGSALASSSYGHGTDLRRGVQRPGVAIARISNDMPPMKRYYESQQTIAELRAIAFVEAQLGEPLREDGPILGMEFDQLPPDAFGAPIASTYMVPDDRSCNLGLETKEPIKVMSDMMSSRSPGLSFEPDAKQIKVSGRALHEYQFLPEQPTIRADTYERATSSHYSSPASVQNARVPLVSTGILHRNEQSASGYPFQGQMSNSNILTQQGSQGHFLPSAVAIYDNVYRKNSIVNSAMDAQYGAHPITQLENPFVASERRVTRDEDVLRIERKRKSDGARMAREVEAHEKRIRKELEKQDIMRRKREEQERKEMERHDRERRKEEERLLREKQKEEERLIREQRREMERREKFIQKESIRAEKMKQKEEMRREKKAARLKVAHERAIARRIARESVELIDDERLEIMELAASNKGLPSGQSLDYEALQNIELYRDMLITFPPKSLEMKKPFSNQPWIDSEDNVGNLLMVWRFLITFADVLGLWPFTLDEFVQAFHDYDPRLLGEVHVALLRSIIKDIEDVARTPSGFGANQNCAANPSGGHPQIVEGAYAWGFNICSWQRHLNLLTWPEILRQLALSAGFGPQLKKKNIEPTYVRDENEGNEGKDIVSNLRNGAAAGNAFARMQERGFFNQRRSRHRLTPGTVKFAAFHVLSLEGNNGLSILEVADRIQKSGLRDLTTSKTPEASIAAALSRDSKLFERTAPSTYCVRPAYRKDPADAEEILSTARERIRIVKSGFLNGEDADYAERDEDSDSDVAEDPEVDDLGTEVSIKKEAQPSHGQTFETPLGNGSRHSEIVQTPESGDRNRGSEFSSMIPERIESAKQASTSFNLSTNTLYQEDTDIDESKSGEPWVQGLTEGEYSDLSVEERLNALVSLISVAVEGNSIRIVLEERLEAAKALKKQMWEDSQLDKRRIKDEHLVKMNYPSSQGNKTEPNLKITLSALVNSDEKNKETSSNPDIQQDSFSAIKNEHEEFNNFPPDGNLQMQEYPSGINNERCQQMSFAAEKSRSQLKSVIGHRAEEIYVYRSLPFGQDRRRNRYWQFVTSTSQNDPGCGRIFVELRNGCWRLIDSEEGFDTLLAALDVRGTRESHLHTVLKKIETSFKETSQRKIRVAYNGKQNEKSTISSSNKMPPGQDCNANTDSPSSTICITDSDAEASSSFTIELGRNESEKKGAIRRYLDFEKWMWKECFKSWMLCAGKYGKMRGTQLLNICNYCSFIYSFEDNHCSSCHKTYYSSESSNISEHVTQCREKQNSDLHQILDGSISTPLRIRLLKMLLALIEDSILPEALQPFWTDWRRKSWGTKLSSSSSAEDLLQILTILESSIKRDHISSNYETTSELLGHPNLSGSSADDSLSDDAPVLPWMPLTTAAAALRLMEFDASVYYSLQQKMMSPDPGSEIFSKINEAFALENEHPREENREETAHGMSSSGRGRGRSRLNGGRLQRTSAGKTESYKRSRVPKRERPGTLMTWKGGRPRGRGKRCRGRRTRRKKSTDERAEANINNGPARIVDEEFPTSFASEQNEARDQNLMEEGLENGNSSEKYEENGEGSGGEYEIAGNRFAGSYDYKADELLDGSDYNGDGYEDEEDDDDIDIDDEEEEGPQDKQGEEEDDVEELINSYSDEGNSDVEDNDLNEGIEPSSDE